MGMYFIYIKDKKLNKLLEDLSTHFCLYRDYPGLKDEANLIKNDHQQLSRIIEEILIKNKDKLKIPRPTPKSILANILTRITNRIN